MAAQDKQIQKIDKENPDTFTGDYDALRERTLKALAKFNMSINRGIVCKCYPYFYNYITQLNHQQNRKTNQ